jgi:hypothetical protein
VIAGRRVVSADRELTGVTPEPRPTANIERNVPLHCRTLRAIEPLR